MLAQLVNRALALHQGGRLLEAEGAYRQAMAAGASSNPQVQHYYAALLYQLQRLPEALAAVEASLRLAPREVESLILQGVLLQSLDRAEDALSSFSKAARVTPNSPDVWYNQGVALEALGRLKEALTAFDRSLGLQPSPLAWHNRGAVLRRLGRPAEALESIERALAAAKDLAPSWFNKALILWELARNDEALAAFDRLLTLQPEYPEAWSQRSALLYTMEQWEPAAASAERAVRLQPGHAAGWTNLGYALVKLDRPAEALTALDRSLAIRPEQESVWRLRGGVLADFGRHPEALQSFERAAALDPRSWEAHVGRAQALGKLRRYDEAMGAYDAASAAAPERFDIWLDRSLAQTTFQRFDESLASIDRAAEIAPEAPPVLFSRGKLLCELRRVGEGLDLLARHARLIYAEGGADEPQRAPEAKQRHDEEQRAWLAARGVAPGGFHIDGGDRVPGPAVNPANREGAAERWAAADPAMVIIDSLLTPPALEGLRRFCLGSTVWRKSFRQGYLGAFVDHGFACPLLAQIAEEMQEVFPTIVGDHGLLTTWGFKYDSRLGGIRIHADQAAVNVNFWITPESANLNPESGGMVIWDAAAPADWEFRRYNGDDDAVRAFLAEAGSKPITVPYRENRAVIFDSDLFHETDRIEFREGYENRRINVTMLFGRRTFYNT
ncbi:MAG TPA: tetratricopeptide repeat protein [Caulobacteraceae bacterium]|jgi:tetratricopeptide (TPR) repeat protein|nr:tetratricopeptide repeat protein [Caulobacteraceae bacterium]